MLVESIRMALAALIANKMRAALTTLGVVIGISTVLMMGWFLSGLDNALEKTLDIFADDVLYVDRWDWTGGNWLEARNRKPITMAQYQQVRDRVQHAEYVVPSASRNASKVQYGDLVLNSTMLMGAGADYTHIIGNTLASGRFFNEVEDNTGSSVAVLGPQIAENLFPNGDPIGKTIRINGLPFVVIGTTPKRGALGMDFVDRQIIIPLRRFFGLFPNERDVTVCVKAGGVEKMEELRYEVIGVMRQIRRLTPDAKDDFAVNEQKAFREQMDQLRVIVFGVGLAMTGLSFLVGSIGIMNIMFVSVTERTKEIGIRKALGATRRSILVQFLVESVMLCLMGAVVAFALTSLSALAISTFAADSGLNFLSATIPPSQIVVAVVVSVSVGVLAGIIPAFRGARMDPVDALRAE
jgi:putative ABC transport system permease protein